VGAAAGQAGGLHTVIPASANRCVACRSSASRPHREHGREAAHASTVCLPTPYSIAAYRNARHYFSKVMTSKCDSAAVAGGIAPIPSCDSCAAKPSSAIRARPPGLSSNMLRDSLDEMLAFPRPSIRPQTAAAAQVDGFEPTPLYNCCPQCAALHSLFDTQSRAAAAILRE
jgi:hypothetical protein